MTSNDNSQIMRAAQIGAETFAQLTASAHTMINAGAGTDERSDDTIEQEIQAKGLTAPRVTPADIEANIETEFYFTGEDAFFANHYLDDDAPVLQSLSLLTFCVLVLRNGFAVTGESACASPENFDADVERKVARQNAVQKVWPLMGYALKQKLHDAAPTRAQRLANLYAEIDQHMREDQFTEEEVQAALGQKVEPMFDGVIPVKSTEPRTGVAKS